MYIIYWQHLILIFDKDKKKILHFEWALKILFIYANEL